VGDAGPDVFVYGTADDSRPGEANRDFINGFENGVDLIDLSSLDGNGRQSGNQAFIWIGTEPFSASGQLRWHSWGGKNYGIVEADQDGDGEADFQIFINLTDYMTSDDFIL
jgi:serralysin